MLTYWRHLLDWICALNDTSFSTTVQVRIFSQTMFPLFPNPARNSFNVLPATIGKCVKGMFPQYYSQPILSAIFLICFSCLSRYTSTDFENLFSLGYAHLFKDLHAHAPCVHESTILPISPRLGKCSVPSHGKLQINRSFHSVKSCFQIFNIILFNLVLYYQCETQQMRRTSISCSSQL